MVGPVKYVKSPFTVNAYVLSLCPIMFPLTLIPPFPPVISPPIMIPVVS